MRLFSFGAPVKKPQPVVPHPPSNTMHHARKTSATDLSQKNTTAIKTVAVRTNHDEPPKNKNRLHRILACLYKAFPYQTFIKTRYAVAIVLMGANFLSCYHLYTFRFAEHYMAVEEEDFFAWVTRIDIKVAFVCRSLLLLPAARIAELYDARWMLFGAMMMCALSMLIAPAFASVLKNQTCFLVAGLLISLMYGVIVPSSHVILARWAPPAERFVMGSLINSGSPFGIAAALFMHAWLSSTVGWQYAYYLAALLSLIWLVLAGIVISDFPEDHHHIQSQEKHYVVKSLSHQLYKYERRRQSRLPLRAMFSSMAVWAFFINNMAFIIANVIYRETRQYFAAMFAIKNEMHKVNQAVVVAYPYQWMGVMTWLFGMFFYIATKHGIFNKLTVYKLGNLISILAVLINLPLTYNLRSFIEMMATPALMVLMAGFLSTSSWNHLELAPNYSGTLIAFATLLGNLPIIALWPWDSLENTRLIRYITAGCLSLLTLFTYTISARTAVEPWNNHQHLMADDAQ